MAMFAPSPLPRSDSLFVFWIALAPSEPSRESPMSAEGGAAPWPPRYRESNQLRQPWPGSSGPHPPSLSCMPTPESFNVNKWQERRWVLAPAGLEEDKNQKSRRTYVLFFISVGGQLSILLFINLGELYTCLYRFLTADLKRGLIRPPTPCNRNPAREYSKKLVRQVNEEILSLKTSIL